MYLGVVMGEGVDEVQQGADVFAQHHRFEFGENVRGDLEAVPRQVRPVPSIDQSIHQPITGDGGIPGPRYQRCRHACIPRIASKRHKPLAVVVGDVLQIQQRPAATEESHHLLCVVVSVQSSRGANQKTTGGDYLPLPAVLVLVDVCKVDVAVRQSQRIARVAHAENHRILGGIAPGTRCNNGASRGPVLVVGKDALSRRLHRDRRQSVVDQILSSECATIRIARQENECFSCVRAYFGVSGRKDRAAIDGSRDCNAAGRHRGHLGTEVNGCWCCRCFSYQ